MPKPKLVRRCPSCGAATRKRAFFCPQCGVELDQKAENLDLDLGANKPNPPPLELTSDPVTAGSEAATPPLPDEVVPAVPNFQTDYQPPHALDSFHRATAAAREIEEDVLQRVEKLRKISTVVLDEAAYDPSLRFVLVAAALFLVFLIILLLSKLIG